MFEMGRRINELQSRWCFEFDVTKTIESIFYMSQNVMDEHAS